MINCSCRRFLTVAVASLSSLGACAETIHAFSTTGYWGAYQSVHGDGVHFSDTNNWNWGDMVGGVEIGLPSSSATDTKIRLFMYGGTAVNDWADDFFVNQYLFARLRQSNTVSGNALNVGSGAIVLNDKEAGVDVATQRIETVVRSVTNNFAVTVPANFALEFHGPIVQSGYYTGDQNITFLNSGTLLLRGGVDYGRELPSNQSLSSTISGPGDVIVESDVRLPIVVLKDGAHLIIRNGAKFEVWQYPLFSYYQQCTVDVEDGYFLNYSRTYSSERSDVTTTFNVRSKGTLDIGTYGLLLGYNGHSVVNIYDGGRMWMRAGGANTINYYGHTDFNLYGGELHCGNNYYGDGRIWLDRQKVKDDTTPSTVNLAGGEVFGTGFRHYAAAAGASVPVNICLDGVTFRQTATSSFFAGGNPPTYAPHDRVRFYMRAGGCTIDTREFNTDWTTVVLRGTDVANGEDGDLVKIGSGKLTVSTNFLFSGKTIVKGGSLAVGAGNYISGGVDLRPSTTLSFTGTSLALASLASRSGIVKLNSGQSLSLSAAPVIDGQIVFDVTVANGTRTLITAPGMTSGLAALCAVKTPVSGKSCEFSVDGDNLVLVVADGTAPAAPVFPASEDASRIYQSSGTATIADSGVERFGGAGTFNYTASGDVTFAPKAVRATGNITLALADGAGDVTLSGPPVKETASEYPAFKFSSGWDNAIRFVGDWSNTWPYEDFGFNFSWTSGNFIYGPELESTKLVQSIAFHTNSSHTVCQSTLPLAASTAVGAVDPMVPSGDRAFVLDGGTVKVTGAGEGSLADFLCGATTFAIGAGGGAIDTCGHDVTITQTLTPTGAVSGTFTKDGEGTLTLAGRSNAIFGGLAVSNGTLVASFDTSLRRPYPAGAMAIWSFDGDNPYEDKTGHGYDLLQAHPDVAAVEFTDVNGMSGKAAKWSSDTTGGSLYVSPENITKTYTDPKRATISAWVRFTNRLPTTASNILSTRTKVDFESGAGNSGFDLAYGQISSTVGYGFTTIWNGGKASIPNSVVGNTPSLDAWHHLVMVSDGTCYKSYLDGVCYTNVTNGSNVPQFLPNNYMITLGEGYAGREFMAKGGMVDEVAVYLRRLSDDEVQSLYAAQTQSGAFDLAVAQGATWDMNASTSTVKTVSGSGTVTNGKLVISEKLVVDLSAGALAVDKLSFGEHGVVDLGCEETDRLATGRFAILTFNELDAEGRTALGGWTMTNAGRNSKCVNLAVEGNTLFCNVTPRGTVILLR